jgi:hypothetical protein
MSLLSKGLKKVGSVAKKAVTGVSKIVTDPGKAIKELGKNVGGAASLASNAVGLIPGVGNVAAPLLAAGGSVLQGHNLKTTLTRGATAAIPMAGGLLGKAAGAVGGEIASHLGGAGSALAKVGSGALAAGKAANAATGGALGGALKDKAAGMLGLGGGVSRGTSGTPPTPAPVLQRPPASAPPGAPAPAGGTIPGASMLPVGMPAAPVLQAGTAAGAPMPPAAPSAPPAGTLPSGAQVTPFTADANLMGQQVTPGAGPNRIDMMKQAMADYDAQDAERRAGGIQQIGQKAAALGRIGAGMTTGDLAGFGRQVEGDRSRVQNELLRGAVDADVTDQRMNRDELRGERDYQVGREQNAFDRRRQRVFDDEALTGNEFNRDLSRLQAGYQGDGAVAGMEYDMGAQQGADANSTLGAGADLISQVLTDRRRKRTPAIPGVTTRGTAAGDPSRIPAGAA